MKCGVRRKQTVRREVTAAFSTVGAWQRCCAEDGADGGNGPMASVALSESHTVVDQTPEPQSQSDDDTTVVEAQGRRTKSPSSKRQRNSRMSCA